MDCIKRKMEGSDCISRKALSFGLLCGEKRYYSCKEGSRKTDILRLFCNGLKQPIVTDKICGFRKFDKVRYFGNDYFIKGRMSTGYAILMDIDGNKIDFSTMPRGYKTPKLSNCKRITARSTVMTQVKVV